MERFFCLSSSCSQTLSWGKLEEIAIHEIYWIFPFFGIIICRTVLHIRTRLIADRGDFYAGLFTKPLAFASKRRKANQHRGKCYPFSAPTLHADQFSLQGLYITETIYLASCCCHPSTVTHVLTWNPSQQWPTFRYDSGSFFSTSSVLTHSRNTKSLVL